MHFKELLITPDEKKNSDSDMSLYSNLAQNNKERKKEVVVEWKIGNC